MKKKRTTNIEDDFDDRLKNEIWDELVQRQGANESERSVFLSKWPECREFRFMGRFGFGGKIRCEGGRVFATCYNEHLRSDTQSWLQDLNERLAEMRESFTVRTYKERSAYLCRETHCRYAVKMFHVAQSAASLFGVYCPHDHPARFVESHGS